MSIRCKLGFHPYKRVGVTKPIRRVGEFMDRHYIGHFAMGQCRRCRCVRLRQVHADYWEWAHSEEVTQQEYYEKFESGEFRLDESGM